MEIGAMAPHPRRSTRLPPGPKGPDSIQEVCETGDNSDRDTPVPIPNTAVKPVRANGTNAQLGVGRVGRRRSHKPLESPEANTRC